MPDISSGNCFVFMNMSSNQDISQPIWLYQHKRRDYLGQLLEAAPVRCQLGLAGLQYKINSTNWYGDSHTGSGDINDLLTNDGAYTTVPTPDYTNLDEGINTVYFRTWDSAGNVTSSYVTAAVKINTSGA